MPLYSMHLFVIYFMQEHSTKHRCYKQHKREREREWVERKTAEKNHWITFDHLALTLLYLRITFYFISYFISIFFQCSLVSYVPLYAMHEYTAKKKIQYKNTIKRQTNDDIIAQVCMHLCIFFCCHKLNNKLCAFFDKGCIIFLQT